MVNQKITREEAVMRVFPERERRSTAEVVVAPTQRQEANDPVEQERAIELLNAKMDRVLLDNATSISALNEKLDRVLAGANREPTQPAAQETVDVDKKISDALQVQAADFSVKFDRIMQGQENERKTNEERFNLLQGQVDEQKETITRLTDENFQLKGETTSLRKKLTAAQTVEEKLRKDLRELKNSKRRADDKSSQERAAKAATPDAKQPSSQVTKPSKPSTSKPGPSKVILKGHQRIG